MKIHRIEVAVRYYETDRMKVAHHTSYLVWFEIGRTSLLHAAGCDYSKIEESGVFLPVIEFSCRLLKSVGFEDVIKIETLIAELRSRSIAFRYRILHDDRLIAEGCTKHHCVDEDNKHRRIPEEIAHAIEDYLNE